LTRACSASLSRSASTGPPGSGTSPSPIVAMSSSSARVCCSSARTRALSAASCDAQTPPSCTRRFETVVRWRSTMLRATPVTAAEASCDCVTASSRENRAPITLPCCRTTSHSNRWPLDRHATSFAREPGGPLCRRKETFEGEQRWPSTISSVSPLLSAGPLSPARTMQWLTRQVPASRLMPQATGPCCWTSLTAFSWRRRSISFTAVSAFNTPIRAAGPKQGSCPFWVLSSSRRQ
jgi:hypothetical protein